MSKYMHIEENDDGQSVTITTDGPCIRILPVPIDRVSIIVLGVHSAAEAIQLEARSIHTHIPDHVGPCES